MKKHFIIYVSGALFAALAQISGQTAPGVPGFVSLTVPAGAFALLGNPLNEVASSKTNTLTTVLPDVPIGTQVLKYDVTARSFLTIEKQGDNAWVTASGLDANDLTLAPGEGFFLRNTGQGDVVLVFDGAIPQGTNVIEIPAGFSLVASAIPQAGRLESDLGFPAEPGVIVYLMAKGSYVQFTRRAGGWSKTREPFVNVAEGFFVYSPKPLKWTRTFLYP